MYKSLHGVVFSNGSVLTLGNLLCLIKRLQQACTTLHTVIGTVVAFEVQGNYLCIDTKRVRGSNVFTYFLL